MKIVIGYRGTNVGQDLLELALKHAQAFDGQVSIITSLKGGETTKVQKIEEAEKNLVDAKAFFDANNVPADIHLLVRGSAPGEDIVKFADDNDADEIIIGVKSRSKVGKLIFGSTAQYVILKANCPVTTLR